MPYFLIRDKNLYHRKIVKGESARDCLRQLEQDREFDLDEMTKVAFFCEDENPTEKIKEKLQDLFLEIEHLANVGFHEVEDNQRKERIETIAKVIREKAEQASELASALGDFDNALFSKDLK